MSKKSTNLLNSNNNQAFFSNKKNNCHFGVDRKDISNKNLMSTQFELFNTYELSNNNNNQV